MNRKEKIQLLKDLRQGKLSIEQILPEEVQVWFKDDGFYRKDYGGKGFGLDEEQFEEYQESKRCRTRYIIFVPAV